MGGVGGGGECLSPTPPTNHRKRAWALVFNDGERRWCNEHAMSFVGISKISEIEIK